MTLSLVEETKKVLEDLKKLEKEMKEILNNSKVKGAIKKIIKQTNIKEIIESVNNRIGNGPKIYNNVIIYLRYIYNQFFTNIFL